jgi:hypothetical protein
MSSSRNQPPEFSGGDSFRYIRRGMDNHLWVVVSDPVMDEARVAVVNFTTYYPFKDGTCRVVPGEHPFVRQETCVEFSGCQIVKLGFLEDRLDRKHIVKDVPLSPSLLERIRNAAIESPHSPFDLQTILIDQGLVIQS